MADEKSSSPGFEQISTFIEKQGISTLLLLAGVYVGYTSVLLPMSSKYMAMLDSVAESNVSLTATIDDLRQGLRDVGESNARTLGETSTHLDSIDDKLNDIEKISRDIDSKLEILTRSRYNPPTPTGDTID